MASRAGKQWFKRQTRQQRQSDPLYGERRDSDLTGVFPPLQDRSAYRRKGILEEGFLFSLHRQLYAWTHKSTESDVK